MRQETRDASSGEGVRHETRDASGDARLKDLSSPVSRPLTFTLKAWPVIALATIGLSFLTQEGAKLLGIDLPEQTNIEIVKRCLSHAFVSAKHFGVAAFLVAQVLVLLPAIEEVVFRWGLFKVAYRLVVVRLLSRLRPGKGARRETRDASGDQKTQKTFRSTAVHLFSPPTFFIALVSSILFSAAHYIAQPWPDNAFLALFFFGLAQCWLYRKTQRLWCAIANHFLFNLTNLVLLLVC